MAAEFDDIDELADLGDLGDLDIGDLEGVEDEGEKKFIPRLQISPRVKKIILISLAAVLVLGTGIYLYATSDTATGREDVAGDDADDDEDAKATPYYFTLDPPFVVNFLGRGQARFLQVNIEGLTRDPSVKEDITLHIPHIRNNIVLLLSSKTYDELITAEGKETLRKEILAEVKKILKRETGRDEVENIYFTSFVMQ